MKVRVTLLLSLVTLALSLGSCHSSRHTARGSHGATVTTGTTRSSVDAKMARSLVDCARGWLGTPYRYGGNDRRGVDCSGLTTNVFLQAAGVTLPRDSRSQKDFCRRIDRQALQPGDLVFFVNSKGGRRVNHVGLYIGGGEMIHASSSRGVIVSDITSGYWDNHYFASGRVDAVTYASLGTRPAAGKVKADKKKKDKKKDKLGDKKAARAVPAPVPPERRSPVPMPAAEIRFPTEPLPAEIPAPAPVTPECPEPVPEPISEPGAEPITEPMAPATLPEPDSPEPNWFD